MIAPPATYIVEGTWPTGSIADNAPSATARIATAAQRILTHSPTAVDQARLATAAGVDPTDLDDLITGAVWPTVDTLARLEQHIGEDLW